MTSTLSRFSNAKLAAVGGSIVISVGALTTLAVMGGIELHSNRVAAAALRNTDAPTSEPSDVPSTEPSNVPSDQPSLRPSSSPTVTTSPSLQPTLSSSPSAVPSVSPSLSLAPTLSAQPSSNPSAIPSLMPSSQPSASPTISTAPSFTPTATPTNKPTPKPTPIRLPSSFRLRMHWERGDFWQDESWEKWYCMACAECNDNIFDQNCDVVNYCRNGMMLALTECRPNRGTDAAKFSLLPGNNKYDLEGDQLQLADRNLCLSLVSARKVKLETCNPYKVEQRFTGFKSESDGAMEIAPVKVAKKDGVVVERCLTQHHHPRQGERLYVEICKLARISDTNLWSVY